MAALVPEERSLTTAETSTRTEGKGTGTGGLVAAAGRALNRYSNSGGKESYIFFKCSTPSSMLHKNKINNDTKSFLHSMVLYGCTPGQLTPTSLLWVQ